MSQAIPVSAVPELGKSLQRIDSLDLLRGISILGIFLMNTWTMSLPQDTYTNPATYNPNWVIGKGFLYSYPDGGTTYTEMQPLTGINHTVYVLIHLFADMKFITTFSILFGAGIVLQAEGSRKKGNNPWLTHYLRMSVLLIFGLIHTFGFWYGDILTDYAMAGVILAPLRLLPASVLFLMGMTMVATTTGIEVAHIEHDQAISAAKSEDEIRAFEHGWYTPVRVLDDMDHYFWNKGWDTFKNRQAALGVDVVETYPDENQRDENDRELKAYRGSWWDQVVGH